jgi:hypothetical protein
VSWRSASKQTTVVRRRLSRSFYAYGGWKYVLLSPFFLFSLIISAISYKSWMGANWIELTYQVVPNLLGFSLGSYAMLFSLISNSIKEALKNVRNSRGVAYMDELNATFMHFITVQILSLVLAYSFDQSIVYDVCRSPRYECICGGAVYRYGTMVFAFLGVLSFLYAISLTLAASLAVSRIATLSEPE